MAILKPIPSSPSRLSLGMRQSSKMMLPVDEARMPSLSSFFPNESPGVGMGTRKALMPLFCKDLSVLAKTTVAEASQQLVIQALVPFRTHESPSARAVVEAAPASLPFPGSLRAKQPILSPLVKGVIHCCFCSLEPNFRMGPK